MFRSPWLLSFVSSTCGLLACTGNIASHTDAPANEEPGRSPSGLPGESPQTEGKPGLPPATLAPVAGLRRLSAYEYDNTLAALLPVATAGAAMVLPNDARTPFDNDHTAQVVSKSLIEGLELVAREASERALANAEGRATLMGCVAKGPDDEACFRSFLARFGRRALRRPLENEEVERFTAAFMPLAREAGEFTVAVSAAVQAFLQHPELVYRVERGREIDGQPGLFRLTNWELASRLSFLLWAGPPDDALLDAAQAGKLGEPGFLRATAQRLLGDERARDTVKRFHALWLNYESFASKDPALQEAMQAETGSLIDRVVFEEGAPWQSLFTAAQSFVTPALARHYSLPEPDAPAGGWVALPTERRGLLGHATFLSNGAKAGDTSPTMRGIAIREFLMCDPVPPPPPGVNADEPPPASGQSQCKTARYSQHAQGGCASCHALIDPLGFGLERFDQQGRVREHEPDNPACPIEGRGELPGLGAFSGPAALADRLLESGVLNRCLVTQLHRFAIGRSQLDETDERFVALLNERHGQAGTRFRLEDVLLDMIESAAFLHRRAATNP